MKTGPRPVTNGLVVTWKDPDPKLLEDQSRAPYWVMNKCGGKVELAICDLRKQYPNWGARILLVKFEGQYPELEISSLSTNF